MKSTLLKSIQKAIQVNQLAAQNGATDSIEWYENQLFNRRNFLKAAALSSFAFSQSACGNKIPTDVKVAVIGAGFAGLNAAYVLKKAGINATIFEASKRVGGRVFTGRNLLGDGLITELGAEFIDTNHTEARNLAKELGLKELDYDKDNSLPKNLFYFQGQKLKDADVIKAFQPYVSKLQTHKQKINESPKARREMDYVSVAEYLERILRLEGWLKDAINLAYLSEYGLECTKQSSLNLLEVMTGDFSKGTFEPYGESDERYKIEGGNDQIASKLEEKLKEQIEFETKLEALKRDANGKYLLSIKQDKKAIEVKADAVIIAIPASILKTIHFDKSLNISQEQQGAIQKFQMGQNGKFFMGFNRPIWREQGQRGYLSSDKPYINAGWDSSQMLGKSHASYTLFYGGNANESFAQNPNDVKAAALKELEALYPGITQQHNGKVEKFHWASFPHSLGSYSCHGLGHYHDVIPHIGKSSENLHFAGEHCSYEFQGFMNGALVTGREAAEKIINVKK